MLSKDEAIEKANRCLGCKKPLCRENGCPIHTRIPEFIAEIKKDNLKQAFQILQDNNIMSEICSLVCPHENYCMGNCVRGIKGEPVDIPILEQYVNQWAEKNNIKCIYEKSKPNNIKIAVIGSGPAGLACAKELAIKGYDVTIFEKEDKIGGTVTYGIPDFRVNKKYLDNIYSKILDLGIKLEFNKELGKDITIDKLKENGFKSIFIGIGANICSTYSLSNKDNLAIYKANELLKLYNTNKWINNLKNVVIIGGGNVAIDASRAVIKMGAETSTIIYRRDKEKMPARKSELDDALNDGVKVIYNTKVIGVEDENGIINSVKCIKTITEGNSIQDIEGSEFLLKADSVIFAIGLKPEENLLKSQGINFSNGYVEIDENMMTNIDGVFAGGDLSQTKPTVGLAISAGKKAAEGIEKYITNLT